MLEDRRTALGPRSDAAVVQKQPQACDTISKRSKHHAATMELHCRDCRKEFHVTDGGVCGCLSCHQPVHRGPRPPLPAPQLTFHVPQDRGDRDNILAQAAVASLSRLAASLRAMLGDPGPQDRWIGPSIGIMKHALFSVCEGVFMDSSRMKGRVF